MKKKTVRMRLTGAVAAMFVGAMILALPQGTMAQVISATIHGHVTNPAGMPLTPGSVKLTTDKNASATSNYEFEFPLDGNGDYKGTVTKAGSYVAVVFQGANHLDYMPVQIAAGDDKTVDFDMTRKEYVDKMSAADKAAVEEYKKNAAATQAENAKIGNLNAMLTKSRADTLAGNYDSAIKAMTDATTAKPDEPILWETLGDAQLAQANAAAKVSKTDSTLPDKYAAAAATYQKALSLNAALAKPKADTTAAANNQLGQVLGKQGKLKEASSAYEAAVTADPTKAGTYYFNEAATLFNGNDMDGAAAAAEKAVAADPTKVDAYYIEGQALVQKATVDPKTNTISAPPECIAAYQKYLELAPTGVHADEVKGILQGIGAPIKSTYKAPKK
jgi:tetratricopeptide (TPR) repeat protein